MPKDFETPQAYQSGHITPVAELTPPDSPPTVTTTRRLSFMEKLRQKSRSNA